jgi:hypothetical protein
LWLSTLMFNKDNQDQDFIDAMYRPIFKTDNLNARSLQ